MTILARQTILLGSCGLLMLAPFGATQSPGDRKYSIDGTVILEIERRPAPGIVVAARSLPDGPSETVVTEEGGSFHFRDLPPGSYDVFAEESGGYAYSHLTVSLDKGSQVLRLDLKSPSSIRVSSPGNIVTVHRLRIPAKARAAFEEGSRHLHSLQPAESLPYFRKAIRMYPDFYEAYHAVGVADLNLARFAEAAEALQKAIDLSVGQYLLSNFSLGVVLWQDKKLPQAETVLRKALEMDPTYATGHLYLSAVLFDQDRLQDAEKSARAAVLRDPELATPYLVLARIYARWGKTEEQLGYLEKYLSLGGDDSRGNVRSLYEAAKSGRLSAQSGRHH